LGQLLKSGWKPRRSLVLCSWDAEEQGLIGSTEWAEEHASELREKAVAYLNMDVAVAGPNFGASSVPSLWNLIYSATQDVRDPKTGKSVYTTWRDRAWENAPEARRYDARGTERQVTAPRIGALGSGSDYTPFLQHLGVPSTDMGFGGDYGVYHSAYDSFYWMTKFGDPTFQYHVAAAQIWGTMALRLANSNALPFDYTDYAKQLREFVNETVSLANRKKMPDAFDEQAMLKAVDKFADEADKLHKRRVDLEKNEPNSQSAERLRRVNDALMQAERAFIDERGLRGRNWYRHQVYAPGFYTGYAALPFPDLRQAIEDGRATDAREAATRIVDAISKATEVLKRGN
jgi:hypothetical protein